MAMTKAERAHLEVVETELAFRWPGAPEPSPMTRDEIVSGLVDVTPRDQSIGRGKRKVALGWVHNAYSMRVEPAWSNGINHGRGNHTGDGGSQGMGRLYRSKSEAALAMRWEMCREFARKLRSVDIIIKGEDHAG